MLNFYFICARGTHGGPEAIHQIVDEINNTTEYSAYVAYFQKQFVQEEKFKCFNVNYINLKDVPDRADTVLCAPETHTYFLRRYKKAKKVIVWLSLYHYLRNIKEEKYTYKERCKNLYCYNRFPKPFYPLYYIRDILQNKNHFKFDMDGIIHTQNCEYVRSFLKEHGVSDNNITFLDGPIRQEYFNINVFPKKENIIAYNPAKGAEAYIGYALEQIKRIDPNISFAPIKNLTVEGVKETLLKAKTYIDFGFFPGPEKLVKEAVLCRCNIITSDFGAAKNSEDILIPQEFKFCLDESPYIQVAELAVDMTENYENYRKYFTSYEQKIVSLKNGFEKAVKDFTDICGRL